MELQLLPGSPQKPWPVCPWLLGVWFSWLFRDLTGRGQGRLGRGSTLSCPGQDVQGWLVGPEE